MQHKSKKTAIIEEYHCTDQHSDGCDSDCNYCKECLESDINDFENEIRADERAKYIELLEMCAEEIENLYGKETELTQKIRNLVK